MPEWELSRRLPWKPSDQADVVTLLMVSLNFLSCWPNLRIVLMGPGAMAHRSQ